MPFLSAVKTFQWTFHARDKMRFYRLSEQRVRQVLHAPKRVEEGVAPKTVAMMQPASVKRVMSQESRNFQETWTQEIWVMIEQTQNRKTKTKNIKVISAWRYPGRTKPRSGASLGAIKEAYNEYMRKIK